MTGNIDKVTKTCTKCAETKLIEEFYRNKDSPDGRRSDCKTCSSAITKAWAKANKEHVSATAKARYEANKERVSARNKARYEANPEAVAARSQRRRATKLRQTPLTWFTQGEIDKQFAYVKRYCRKWGKALGIQWDVDHVVPLNGMIGGTAGTKVVSGLHWGGNFAALPSKHNTSKQCYEWPDKWNYDNTYYDEETGTLLEREPSQVGD